MTNDLSVGLLTVVGVLAGLASLLVLLSALEPTHVRRTPPNEIRRRAPAVERPQAAPTP